MKYSLLFVLTLMSVVVHAQTILPGRDPCSDKVYILNHPSRVDTSHTYIEAVRAYFERHKGVIYEQFNVSNASELDVRLIRASQNHILLFVEPQLSDTASLLVSLSFSGVPRDTWYKPSAFSGLMPEVVTFSDAMGINARNVVGVPSGNKTDYIFDQAFIQPLSNILLQDVDTIVGVRDEIVLNPIFDNNSPYAPRAYLSADSATLAIYLFVPVYRPVQKGSHSLVRILANLGPARSIRYSLLPAYIFGSYGFEYGDCEMLGFY